MYCS